MGTWYISTRYDSNFGTGYDNTTGLRFYEATEPSIFIHRCLGTPTACREGFSHFGLRDSELVHAGYPNTTVRTSEFTADIGSPDSNGVISVTISKCTSTYGETIESHYINPPESSRSYSSAALDANTNVGGSSVLKSGGHTDLEGPWIPVESATNTEYHWVQLDLDSQEVISGIVTQCALTGQSECVNKVAIETSTDNVSWTRETTGSGFGITATPSTETTTAADSLTKHAETNCDGTGTDSLRDYVGTEEECTAKCIELAEIDQDQCAGFIRVQASSKCYFRHSPLQNKNEQAGRDCFVYHPFIGYPSILIEKDYRALNLAEVELYDASNNLIDPIGAEQSTTLNNQQDKYTAASAIDGDLATFSITTELDTAENWLRIYYNVPVTQFDRILVKNRLPHRYKDGGYGGMSRIVGGSIAILDDTGSNRLWDGIFSKDQSVYEFGTLFNRDVEETTYTNVLTETLFTTPVAVQHVRITAVQWKGYGKPGGKKGLAMRAGLVRITPRQIVQPDPVDCTDKQGTTPTSKNWVASTNTSIMLSYWGSDSTGESSLEACKAKMTATSAKYFAWAGGSGSGSCRFLQDRWIPCNNWEEKSSEKNTQWTLYERDASVPTDGEGVDNGCDGLVTGGECTHKCLDGYVDNNGGLGQRYTCLKNKYGTDFEFVGRPLTCTPGPCDASAVPANGYHAEYNTLPAGRYIYIQNVPGEYIHLTEVEAFDGAGTVIDATVAEMSTVGWGGVPGNCIDGNLGEPVCHTQGGASEWLKIDYGEETTIASIVVHNRPNNKNRIDGAKISITNDDGVAVWSSTIEGSHATYTFAGPAVCSSSIPSGSSCAPSCNEGHVAVGERSCFAGVMTDTFICTPTDCECKNGGIQSGSMAGGDCSCDCANVAGFEGDTCEDPTLCNSGCENGGTPSGSVAGGDCGCDCSTAPGFVGPTCSDANSDCEELCSPSGMRMRGFRKLKP